MNTYKTKRKEITQYLNKIIADEREDPFAKAILTLAADEGVTRIKTTDKAIDQAHKRKLLGNPPSSTDKYTIGDELIWELLLASLQNQDLIVVTGDGTYEDNLPLLAEEFHDKTNGRLLLVTDKLSDVDKELGQPINPKLIEVEKKEEEIARGMDWPVGSSYFPFRPFQKEFDHRIYQLIVSGSPGLLPGSESVIFGLPKKD